MGKENQKSNERINLKVDRNQVTGFEDFFNRLEPLFSDETFQEQALVGHASIEDFTQTPNRAELGVHYLNTPYFNPKVIRNFATGIYNYVCQQNEMYKDTRFWDHYPDLDLTTGLPYNDDWNRSCALAIFIFEYLYDVVELQAIMQCCFLWTRNRGSGATSQRAANYLKVSRLNTVLAGLPSRLPVMKALYDYVLQNFVALTRSSPSKVLTSYPIPMTRFYGNYVDQPSPMRKADGTIVGYDKGSMLVPQQGFQFSNLINDYSVGSQAIWGFNGTGGCIAGPLYAMLVAKTDQVYDRYISNVLNDTSNMLDFMKKVGAVDLEMDILKYSFVVFETVPGDYDKFFKERGIYFENPGPRLRSNGYPSGVWYNGTLPPYVNDDGEFQRFFQYRQGSISKQPSVAAMDAAAECARATSTAGSRERLLAGVTLCSGIFIKTPEARERLLYSGRLGTGERKTEALGTTGGTFQWKDITWDDDWAVSFGCSLNDGLFVQGSAVTVGTYDDSRMEVGWRALQADTNIQVVDDYGTFPTQQEFLPYTGFALHKINLTLLFDQNALQYTGKLGEMVQDIVNAPYSKAAPFMSPELVAAGIYSPDLLMCPLINQFDYLQCGSSTIVSQEDTEASDYEHQYSKWGKFLDSHLKTTFLASLVGINNAWDSSLAGTVRNILKDFIVYLGDDFGATPIQHFSREDLHGFHHSWSNQPQDGVLIPVKPFVNRQTPGKVGSRRAKTLIGQRFLDLTGSGQYRMIPEVFTPNTRVVAASAVDSTGLRRPVFHDLLGHLDILPSLVYHWSRPVADRIRGYINWAVSRAEAYFSGRQGVEIVKALTTLPVGAGASQEAVAKVMTLPKASNKGRQSYEQRNDTRKEVGGEAGTSGLSVDKSESTRGSTNGGRSGGHKSGSRFKSFNRGRGKERRDPRGSAASSSQPMGDNGQSVSGQYLDPKAKRPVAGAVSAGLAYTGADGLEIVNDKELDRVKDKAKKR